MEAPMFTGALPISNGMSPTLLTATFAIVGGFIPPLIWLWFWLKEDAKRPEPRKLIMLAFLSGIISIIPILYLEIITYARIENETLRYIIWAAIEEIGKLAIVYIAVLRRKEVDEPIDYVVYMITVALGFAALENVLFLLPSETNRALLTGIITGNLRFIGSTLLHVTASAIIGLAMGFSFYKTKKKKWVYLVVGIMLATALHAAFNLSIINIENYGGLIASMAVWISVIALLLIFGKIKRIQP